MDIEGALSDKQEDDQEEELDYSYQYEEKTEVSSESDDEIREEIPPVLVGSMGVVHKPEPVTLDIFNEPVNEQQDVDVEVVDPEEEVWYDNDDYGFNEDYEYVDDGYEEGYYEDYDPLLYPEYEEEEYFYEDQVIMTQPEHDKRYEY